ncbi:MAG TPA: hypothetical protein VMP03_00960, partial [Methylomirabilota bacterium]|nr:hypothetical protein [Methylomirabilota bacterium]
MSGPGTDDGEIEGTMPEVSLDRGTEGGMAPADAATDDIAPEDDVAPAVDGIAPLEDDTAAPPEDEGAPRVVRQAAAHDSAIGHVTGAAVYIDDMREPEGTLHVAPGWCADLSSGRIRDLDLSRVRGAPGVVAVLTAADVPGVNDCSPSIGGDPVLADGEVEFWGQAIFCVVATSREAARSAARLALFEGEAVTPIVTVADARKANSHVLPEYRFGRGDVQTSLSNAQRRLEGRMTIGGQEHFYL